MPVDYSALPPDVIKRICDFETNEPYQNAQTVNCDNGHSYSLSTAMELFGAMRDGACERSDGRCPICRGRVTAYRSNPGLQDLVNATLGLDRGLPSDKVNQLVRKLKLEFDNGQMYPVAKTHFTLCKSRFEENYTSLCTYKEHRGVHIDEAVEIFSVKIEKFGKKRISFRVDLHFHKSMCISALKFQEFAKRNGVNSSFERHQKLLSVESAEPKDVVIITRLIMQFNTFGEEALADLTELLLRLEALIPEPVTAPPSELAGEMI